MMTSIRNSDNNAGRTKLIGVDVMMNNGTHFYKTLYYRAKVSFGFGYGAWMTEVNEDEITAWVRQQLPSLENRPFTIVLNR